MRPRKITDVDLLNALAKVFRDKGYEGSSLNQLAEETGLKKASLYHRFPKGKQEMAESVLDQLDEWIEMNIFSAFYDKEFLPETRLKNGLSKLSELYDGGKNTCILRAFSMQMGVSIFEKKIKDGMNEWINAFTKIGIALNAPPEIAKEIAMLTFIEIQGSLVVSKGLNDPSAFEKTLLIIESRYLNL